MAEAVRVTRHPIRAFFGGLLLGIGVAVLLITYGVIALGTNTPYVVVLLGIAVVMAWAYFAPVRTRHAPRR